MPTKGSLERVALITDVSPGSTNTLPVVISFESQAESESQVRSLSAITDESRKLAKQQQSGRVEGPSFTGALFGLIVLVVIYLGLSLVIPIDQATPLVDEPIYASSAFEFAQSGAIRISNLSAPNALFDTVWGGSFAWALGRDYGSLRLSTIVLTAISAPFMYLLCRSLGAPRALSVAGTAAYLFAPLAFTLSVTFQTDAHFSALVVMAVAPTSLALKRETNQLVMLLVGSFFVTLAFLSRPQAVIVTIAAVLIWLVRGPRGSSRYYGIAAVTALPIMGFLAHALWVSGVGAPYIREFYRNAFSSLDLQTVLVLSSQSLVDGVTYIGLFSLPFLPLLIAPARRVVADRRWLAIFLASALGAFAIGSSVTGFGPLHLQAWVTDTGFGAVDRSFLGNRPALPGWIGSVLVTSFLASAYALILCVSRRRDSHSSYVRDEFVILTFLGFWAGALISSLALHGRILDRYWVPLIPLAVALAVSSSRPTRRGMVTTLALAGAMGLVTVVGMIDAFSVYRAAESFADDVIAAGMDPLSLEAGASWSASYFGLSDDDLNNVTERRGPFWVKFYAVDSDPEYGIVLEPLDGYTVLERREYASILHPGPDFLYFVHREPDLPFYFRSEDL